KMKLYKKIIPGGLLLLFALHLNAQHTKYPMERPPRTEPAPATSKYTIYPDRPKQTIKGLGVEIYSDMLNNQSDGMDMPARGIPHELVPAERTRLYKEMLTGFRYARLAGG